jgi:hypothetical protein
MKVASVTTTRRWIRRSPLTKQVFSSADVENMSRSDTDFDGIKAIELFSESSYAPLNVGYGKLREAMIVISLSSGSRTVGLEQFMDRPEVAFQPT